MRLSKKKTLTSKLLFFAEETEGFFGSKNICGFYGFNGPDYAGHPFIVFTIYKCFRAQCLFDETLCSRADNFSLGVYLSDKPTSLRLLLLEDSAVDLPQSFTRRSLRKNFKALDWYLRWRMTDEQKKEFGFI